MRKLPKDVLKMASGLILPSGLAGHRRPLCTGTGGGGGTIEDKSNQPESAAGRPTAPLRQRRRENDV